MDIGVINTELFYPWHYEDKEVDTQKIAHLKGWINTKPLFPKIQDNQDFNGD